MPAVSITSTIPATPVYDQHPSDKTRRKCHRLSLKQPSLAKPHMEPRWEAYSPSARPPQTLPSMVRTLPSMVQTLPGHCESEYNPSHPTKAPSILVNNIRFTISRQKYLARRLPRPPCYRAITLFWPPTAAFALSGPPQLCPVQSPQSAFCRTPPALTPPRTPPTRASFPPLLTTQGASLPRKLSSIGSP